MQAACPCKAEEFLYCDGALRRAFEEVETRLKAELAAGLQARMEAQLEERVKAAVDVRLAPAAARARCAAR